MQPSPRSHEQPARSIAVVDDIEDLAATVVMLLEAEGYVAEYALTGAAGLALVNRMGADAVLLDFMLPDMTGAAVGNALRRSTATSGIKILMCTSTPEETVRAEFSSYNAFLCKPVAHGHLVRALVSAFAPG